MPQTRDAIAVTFEVPPSLRDRFAYAPGQFLTLEAEIAGERVRRSYSICSTPHDAALRVAIKRVPGGVFSTWAHDALAIGATLAIGPPDGRFGIAFAAQRRAHYLFFAAGSGITPILSLIAHALETEPQSRVTLVYGNRATSGVMFREELQALKDRFVSRFAMLFVMSREPQEIDAFSGRIDRAKCDVLFETWIDPATVDVAFVCGPAGMNDAVVASLATHGIAGDRVRVERFASNDSRERPRAVASDATAICDARAIVDGRTFAFPIERGAETVLDAGLRAGIELPYSCKAGVCSTCRVVLVAGEVDMDVHYALEDYEIARGFILMCQSYPATPTLVIDVDARSQG